MLSTNTPNSVTIRLKHAHPQTRHMICDQQSNVIIWLGMWFMYILDHYNQKLHEKYDYIQTFTQAQYMHMHVYILVFEYVHKNHIYIYI